MFQILFLFSILLPTFIKLKTLNYSKYISQIVNSQSKIDYFSQKIIFKYFNETIILVRFMNYGNKLKELRTENLYTQEYMAQKLNISRPLVTHYEKGVRTIRTADLKGICELSGISADWCVGKLNYKLKIKTNKKIKPKEIKKLMGV